LLPFKLNSNQINHQDAADSALVRLIHQTQTTELEDQQDSNLPAIAAALVPIHSMAWKTAQRLFNRLAATGVE
jgi:hypothetical protein